MQGVVHNGGKIIIINEFFGVAHFLEAFKDGVDFLFREDMAQLFQPGFDGSAPECLVSGSSVAPQPTACGSMTS